MAESTTFTFDLDKISLDDALDVMEFDPDNKDPRYIGRLVKTLRKALIKGDRELTGADLIPVIQGFMTALSGGGNDLKN